MKKPNYTHEELIEAYLAWVNAKPPRTEQWHHYCDVRDGLPLGKSEEIFEYRLYRKEEERRVYQ